MSKFQRVAIAVLILIAVLGVQVFGLIAVYIGIGVAGGFIATTLLDRKDDQGTAYRGLPVNAQRPLAVRPEKDRAEK